MPRILVIEDSPVLHPFIEISLRGHVVEVIPAAKGRAGLDTAIEDPPDLILLDLGLPDIDGWDVLDELRSHPETERIPVLVSTGWEGNEISVRAHSRGAEVLPKPYAASDLRAAVLAMLGTEIPAG
jgi:two-component system KDP operon response regulator KdpE